MLSAFRQVSSCFILWLQSPDNVYVCLFVFSNILRATNSLSRILVEDFLGSESSFNSLVSGSHHMRYINLLLLLLLLL